MQRFFIVLILCLFSLRVFASPPRAYFEPKGFSMDVVIDGKAFSFKSFSGYADIVPHVKDNPLALKYFTEHADYMEKHLYLDMAGLGLFIPALAFAKDQPVISLVTGLSSIACFVAAIIYHNKSINSLLKGVNAYNGVYDSVSSDATAYSKYTPHFELTSIDGKDPNLGLAFRF